jgi:dCTP deaminase
MESTGSIKHYYKDGDIIIEPYREANVGPNSYDVTLGEWYIRERPPTLEYDGRSFFNPFSEQDVQRVWGKPQLARPVFDAVPPYMDLSNFKEHHRAIVLAPHENILCHTQEFIGSQRMFATTMKARSSWGRSFTTVCRCAGQGDVGYFNRWTMEVTNNSRYHNLVLLVGMRMAQLTFDRVASDHVSYSDNERKSKYQASPDIETLMEEWRPTDMLPRLYMDRELRDGT